MSKLFFLFCVAGVLTGVNAAERGPREELGELQRGAAVIIQPAPVTFQPAPDVNVSMNICPDNNCAVCNACSGKGPVCLDICDMKDYEESYCCGVYRRDFYRTNILYGLYFKRDR